MGTGGHNASFNGQDYAVVHAAAGQMAQLDLRALWLSQNNNVRVTVDGGEETLLRGTELPPPEGGGRRFRSKTGGKIQVMLVTDDPASLSFVSLAVSMACLDVRGCGGHGQCMGGNCTCADGYSGMGAMRVSVEQLELVLLRFDAYVQALVYVTESSACGVAGSRVSKYLSRDDGVERDGRLHAW